MFWSPRPACTISALLLPLLLGACGGGGSDQGSSSTPPPAQSASTTQTPSTSSPTASSSNPGAPTATGDSAADGFNWFNYRRQQIGLQALRRNAQVDVAAQGHSDYQKTNKTITHDQDPAKPGFTGEHLADRLAAAGYRFTQGSYAYGEVISSTTDRSGANAAEALIAAIYHRFLIFEPMFSEAGAGAASVSGGYMYFTTDFTANGLDYSKGLADNGIVTYPFANQTGVPVNFFSDYEVPDPVPDRNEVGYPISVHANIDAAIVAQSFTVAPRGGAALPTQSVNGSTTGSSGASAIAIVPLEPLRAATTYDVQFSGTVKGARVNRSWSFTTR
jgi:uncharacterized protein YkwD